MENLKRVVLGKDCSEGSMLGGGIQISFEGGVSDRNLVTKFVWFCFKSGL